MTCDPQHMKHKYILGQRATVPIKKGVAEGIERSGRISVDDIEEGNDSILVSIELIPNRLDGPSLLPSARNVEIPLILKATLPLKYLGQIE